MSRDVKQITQENIGDISSNLQQIWLLTGDVKQRYNLISNRYLKVMWNKSTTIGTSIPNPVNGKLFIAPCLMTGGVENRHFDMSNPWTPWKVQDESKPNGEHFTATSWGVPKLAGWFRGNPDDLTWLMGPCLKKSTWEFPLLVGGFSPPLWKMMEFVNWEDEKFPILMGKCQKWQPNHQPDDQPSSTA